MIPVVGRIYRFTSRNLELGVCIKSDPEAQPEYSRYEFLGVREKFAYRYLSTEYGWNITEDLGPLPEGIEPRESFPGRSHEGEPITMRNDILFDYLEGLR